MVAVSIGLEICPKDVDLGRQTSAETLAIDLLIERFKIRLMQKVLLAISFRLSEIQLASRLGNKREKTGE